MNTPVREGETIEGSRTMRNCNARRATLIWGASTSTQDLPLLQLGSTAPDTDLPIPSRGTARMGFPSGHASGSVAALLHTSLRLLGALRVGYTPRAVPLGRTGCALELDGLLTMLCLGPTLVAAWVAASRVHDNAHHPADVVGGAVVGWMARHAPKPSPTQQP